MKRGPWTVISGGQTGVDQAALRAAQHAGLRVGGWCPPGRVSEAGRIPNVFPMRETPYERSEKAPEVPRSLRTEWNVRDSNATLILTSDRTMRDAGTGLSARFAEEYERPLLICDPTDIRAADQILQWLAATNIETLNVAGPSESLSPGIGEQVYRLLTEVFNSKHAC